MNYKFKGGDKVIVNTEKWFRKETGMKGDFTGTIVMCISDMPVIGQTYVVLADNPKEVGLMTEVYPYPAIPCPESILTER